MKRRGGASRLTRRTKNERYAQLPEATSRRTKPVIRYPLITKKTSTPTNPPGSQVALRWKTMTDTTAIALRPSISGR
jgi:hypothetical protein